MTDESGPSGTTYDFRLRFNLPPGRGLAIPDNKYVLQDDGGAKITLRGKPNMAISDSDWLAVHGSPFSSENAARVAGREWRGRLSRAFASVTLGVDFGHDLPMGWLSPAGRAVMEDASGAVILDDVHGLMVFPTAPRIHFFSASGSGHVASSPAPFLAALRSSHNQPPTSNEELAFALYAAAQALTGTAPTKLVALMMSLEVLIDPAPKSPEAIAAVERMIELAANPDIAEAERQSLKGSLEWLKRESISTAGRRLVDALGDRTYGGVSPRKFFKSVYDVRSKLVHGSTSRPTDAEVSPMVRELNKLVGDLIATVPLLDDLA